MNRAAGDGALIVLPTYNEAGNVGEALGRIRAAAPGADVLVVDDSSPDGTASVAEAAAVALGRITVVNRPVKAGLGSAYRLGFRYGLACGYTALVEMDADLSHDPADLPSLLDAVARGADLAIGSRYVAGGATPDWSRRRKALSRWGNRYAARTLGLRVRDSTSGFRAFRADALRALDLDAIRAEGYGFQIEMAYRIARLGGCVVEAPIEFRDRTCGQSKMSGRIIIEALALVSWWGLCDRLASHAPAAGAELRAFPFM